MAGSCARVVWRQGQASQTGSHYFYHFMSCCDGFVGLSIPFLRFGFVFMSKVCVCAVMRLFFFGERGQKLGLGCTSRFGYPQSVPRLRVPFFPAFAAIFVSWLCAKQKCCFFIDFVFVSFASEAFVFTDSSWDCSCFVEQKIDVVCLWIATLTEVAVLNSGGQGRILRSEVDDVGIREGM